MTVVVTVTVMILSGDWSSEGDYDGDCEDDDEWWS